MFISEDMKRRGGTLVRTNKEITTDERQLLLSMYINVLNYIPSQTDVFVFFAIWVQTCVCFVSVRHRKFFTQHKYCAIFNSSYTPLTSDVHIYNRSPHASKSNTHAKASWNRLPLAFELLDKKNKYSPFWPRLTDHHCDLSAQAGGFLITEDNLSWQSPSLETNELLNYFPASTTFLTLTTE